MWFVFTFLWSASLSLCCCTSFCKCDFNWFSSCINLDTLPSLFLVSEACCFSASDLVLLICSSENLSIWCKSACSLLITSFFFLTCIHKNPNCQYILPLIFLKLHNKKLNFVKYMFNILTPLTMRMKKKKPFEKVGFFNSSHCLCLLCYPIKR